MVQSRFIYDITFSGWKNNVESVIVSFKFQLNKEYLDTSGITSSPTRSPSLHHIATERPYMSNISYVVIPTKGSVRVLYKRHWKPGVTVSSLLIDRVNYTHSGIFWCMPSNSANRSVHVHVLKGEIRNLRYEFQYILTQMHRFTF